MKVWSRWRVALSLAASLIVLFAGSLAFNAASDAERWPGPLDVIRANPWYVLLGVIPLAILAVWPVHEVSAKPMRHPPMRSWGLPSRNPLFTGRSSELARLGVAKMKGDGISVHVIRGMAGVGKSQLAVEFAYRLPATYKFIGFLNAERSELLAAEFASLAGTLGVHTSGNHVQAVYEKLTLSGRWILVFDNATTARELRGYLPAGTDIGNGRIVITTGARDWDGLASVVDLAVFNSAESEEFLTRRLPLPYSELCEIADALGNLPLALEQAAAFMQFSGTSPDTYLRLIEGELEQVLDAVDVPDYRESVSAGLWTIARERLKGDLPSTIQLMEVLALLAPEPVPIDLLASQLAHAPPPLNAAAANATLWERTVGAAVRQSLIRRDGDHLIVHRLTQAAIRAHMPPDQHAKAKAFLYRALTDVVPRDVYGSPPSWPRWRELLPHVLTLCGKDVSDRWPREQHLLLELATQYLWTIGSGRQALVPARLALEISEAVLGPDSPQAATDLANLGRIHHELGLPWSAKPYFERSLAIREHVTGSTGKEVGFSLVALARVHRDLSRPWMALALGLRALRIHEDIFGPDALQTSFVNAVLASIWLDLGDAKRGLVLAKHALEVQQRCWSENEPRIAAMMILVAQAWVSNRRPDIALPLAEQALMLNDRNFGPSHHYMGMTQVVRAAALDRFGRTADALVAAEEATRILDEWSPRHKKASEAHDLAAELRFRLHGRVTPERG
ncbi:tetratricopeptide repeat protein [Micromonospora gifhornensis]|uniref:tetratricopeptide repeat protein n=1 Tax=Micromonospora gifhornensis TaxID=84594 RepID=UPI003665F4A5